MNLQRQPFGKRRLAHPGFTHEDWIILASTTKDPRRARQFLHPPNQRINLPFGLPGRPTHS